MRVMVNGEPRDVPDGATVADLLRELGLDPGRVAVERNLEVVRRGAFAATVLAEGDALEIVHFVGGG